MRLGDLERLLLALGATIEKPSGGGSHWMVRAPGRRPFPISLHNGKRGEVGDDVLRGIAKLFGMTKQELLNRARG